MARPRFTTATPAKGTVVVPFTAVPCTYASPVPSCASMSCRLRGVRGQEADLHRHRVSGLAVGTARDVDQVRVEHVHHRLAGHLDDDQSTLESAGLRRADVEVERTEGDQALVAG